MANAGVREFLATLDQSLVDIDAVISDLAKEDCDDIEVHMQLQYCHSFSGLDYKVGPRFGEFASC